MQVTLKLSWFLFIFFFLSNFDFFLAILENDILKCYLWPSNLQIKFEIVGHAEFSLANINSVTFTH